jgi:hypothetical protein
VEFSLFSWFFYLVVFNDKIKKIIPALVILFILFNLFIYFISHSGSFGSLTVGLESVLIIAMCIYYFFDQLKQPNTFLIYSSINFWIIISFLIYLSGTFFLYIYADSMINNKAFLEQYMIINSSFIILKSILLSIAMLMKSDQINNQSLFPEDTLNADWSTNRSLHNLN